MPPSAAVTPCAGTRAGGRAVAEAPAGTCRGLGRLGAAMKGEACRRLLVSDGCCTAAGPGALCWLDVGGGWRALGGGMPP